MTSPAAEVSKSLRFIHYWLPVLGTLIIQFLFSTDLFSSEHTSRIILPILKFLLPQLEINQLILLHHVIRKAGHVAEYCILGVLIYRALHLDIRNAMTVRTLTIAGIAVAAVLDEFHQSFVPARTSSIGDVAFDCIGGVCAILLISVWRIARASE